jgi:hypothetical protein
MADAASKLARRPKDKSKTQKKPPAAKQAGKVTAQGNADTKDMSASFLSLEPTI